MVARTATARAVQAVGIQKLYPRGRFKAYRIGHKKFDTKKQLKVYTRTILDQAAVGQTLAGEKATFLYELFRHHPEADVKLAGMKGIRVRTNRMFRQREFCIVKGDGDEYDISFNSSITGKHSTNTSNFNKACRFAVSDQIAEFKKRAFKETTTLACPLSGEVVTAGNAHVDHETPQFSTLVAKFIEDHRVDLCATRYKPIDHRTDFGAVEFADAELGDKFGEYHRTHAKLRILSAKANLNRKRAPKKRKATKRGTQATPAHHE